MTEPTQSLGPDVPSGSSDDDEVTFPGNWVTLFADLRRHASGMPAVFTPEQTRCPFHHCCRIRIEDWGRRYPWRYTRGAVRFDPSRKSYDDEGFALACELSALLPQWVVEYVSNSGGYRTPNDEDVEIVIADGRFVDPTEEQSALRKRLFEEENGRPL